MDIHSSLEQFQASYRVPPSPHVVTRLLHKLQEQEPDIDSLAGIIAEDVSLAALVLKTVNSPLFGMRSKVSSIKRAANLLGLLNISNIVIALALKKSFEDNAVCAENFWDSPFNVANIAANVARRVPGVLADEAYLLGLFHNSGQALMLQKFPDYAQLLHRCDKGCAENVCELEERAFGTHHATLGYFLARGWGLPKKMATLIYQHHHADMWLHDEAGEDALLLAVLKMSEHIDHLHWGADQDPEWEQIGAAVLSMVGMSQPDFDEFAEDMLEKLALGDEHE